MTEPVSTLKYPNPTELRLFDPNHPHKEDAELKEVLKGSNPDEPQNIFYLPLFSMAIHMGFKKVSYSSHNLPDGRFFAMTTDRCEAFGQSITRDLQFLGLELTCFLPGTAQFIERGIDHNEVDGVFPQVYELLFAHKSGDEVTIEEATAFARIIHKLNVRIAHLWAGEFDGGSLDALSTTLNDLGNKSLCLADICDVSEAEPDDRVRHPGIEELVQNNRRNSGPVVSDMGTAE